ncbi:peptidoglycan/LPS O-acetylase OafA/YrhL [Nocardia sp. GAS34]|uniref:acyltransferase family protein n=1 Tax=unclassified Nocardia TaxID=2637762 RepID=UPI003D2163C8
MTEAASPIRAADPADAAPGGVRTAPAEAASPPKIKRPYLYQADLFRIITFLCVIGGHVVDGANSMNPGNVTAQGAEVLLHYTRQAFFTLTAFVLVYQYARRPFSARGFWRRRFALVGIPYVAWSVVYWAYPLITGMWHETVPQALQQLLVELATGNAWYQMYFLLVTMQVYLLFPLILKLLDATQGYHRWLVAAGAALQLVFLWYFVHPPEFTGLVASIWNHVYALVIAYPFYVIFGAVAAWHMDTVIRIVRRFGPLLVAGGITAAVFAEWYYLRSVDLGMPPWTASNVFMPHLLPVFALIILGQYTVCYWWAGIRRDGTLVARTVSWGADRSFGVFLLHPLALQLLAPYIVPLQQQVGSLLCTTIIFVSVLAMSLAGTEVLRRIPGSLWLTGRPMIHTDFTPLTRRSRTT